jgi:Phage terminase large subunit
MTKIKLNFPKPNKVFNKQIYDVLFDYSRGVEVWYGGASSGKSHGVVQKVVAKSLQPWKYPRKVLWLRKVDRTIKESIFADVLDCLSTWKILRFCKVNKSDRTIELPNGSVFCSKEWMILKKLSRSKVYPMWSWKKRLNLLSMILPS